MSDDADEPIALAASAGDLDPVVLLLREFLHRSGAIRAVAVVDRSGLPPAVVDCARLEPIAIDDGESEEYFLPHAIELDATSLPVPEVRQLPRFDVDAETGEIAAPLGGLEHHAGAVRQMANTLGNRSVAIATFATTTAETPLSISAQIGEPLVLSLGEEQFEMDPGWPAL